MPLRAQHRSVNQAGKKTAVDAIKHYLMALAVFLLLDGLWIGLVAKNFYQAQIGFLLSGSVNWAAAGLFYLLFVAGLVVFVVSPGVRQGSPGKAALRGALFGLVTYAAYDLTNLATIDRWPVLVTVVDLVWGAALSGTASFVVVWSMQKKA